jgi:hypothetical protein
MSEGPKIGAGGSKKQIHRAKSARWRTGPPRCARQDDGEREVASGECRVGSNKRASETPALQRHGDDGAETDGGAKTTEPSAQLRIPAAPASLLSAENSFAFAQPPLDTAGRTETHASDSKQTTGVVPTRHSCEHRPRRFFHPNPASGRLPSFYGVSKRDPSSLRSLGMTTNGEGQKPLQWRATAKTETAPSAPGPGPCVLTLAGAFPIIARRLLHRPIPKLAKEPRV